MGHRGRYEFSRRTRDDARVLANHECEECTNDGFLEVHHIIAIWAAKRLGLPHMIISSLANAECLCFSCHIGKHEYEPVLIEYKVLAQAMFGLNRLI